MITSPIIIVGNPRSGTTLIRLLLTCHPNICIPPEGPFIVFLGPKYGHINYFNDIMIEQFVDDLLNVTKMDEWKFDRVKLIYRLKNCPRSSFTELVDGVYSEYMSTIGQIKKRWGDKSGTYTIKGLDIIKRYIPNALLLHIIRDGRDVACSYRRLQGVKGKYAPCLPTRALEIAYNWKSNVNLIEQFLYKWPADQQATIRYEDLVRCPDETLKKLCNKLGEDYYPEMLEFHQYNKKLLLEPKIYFAWKQKTFEEVSTSQIGRWKEEMSGKDIHLFESLAGDILSHYKYELHNNSIQKFGRFQLKMQLFFFYLKKAINFGILYFKCLRFRCF